MEGTRETHLLGKYNLSCDLNDKKKLSALCVWGGGGEEHSTAKVGPAHLEGESQCKGLGLSKDLCKI